MSSEKKSSGKKAAAVIVALIIIIGIAVAAYQTSKPTPPPAPAPPNVVVVGLLASFDISFDPVVGWDQLEAFMDRNTYDTLIQYDQNTLQLKPSLATSWEAINTTMYTFHLRQGVKFHDGTSFNATAVKFSIDRCNALGGSNAYYCAVVKEVQIVDDYTVNIVLKYPYAAFLDDLTWYAFSMVSPSAVAAHGDKWLHDNEAGTGRYRMVEYKPNEQVVLEANKDHYEPPKNDKVIVKLFSDETHLPLALKNGEVDLIDTGTYAVLPPDDLKSFENNTAYKVYDGGGAVMIYMEFGINTMGTPYNNLWFRKAVASSIDRDAIVNDVFKGTVVKLETMVPTYMRSYSTIFSDMYPHNITGAKEYLKMGMKDSTCGYGCTTTLKPAKLKSPVTFELDLDSSNRYNRIVGELLKAQLGEAGITVNLNLMESGTFWDTYYKHQLPSLLDFWGPSYNDEDDPLFGLYHPSSSVYTDTVYNNSKMTELLEKARATSDPDQRKQTYMEVQKIGAEEVPYIPVYQVQPRVVTASYVTGMENVHQRYATYYWMLRVEKTTSAAILGPSEMIQYAGLNPAILSIPSSKLMDIKNGFTSVLTKPAAA